MAAAAILQARRRLSIGSVARMWRRALVESLYLLTAPLGAVLGLPLLIVCLGAGLFASVLPGRASAKLLTMARLPGDVEWWRIRVVRPVDTAGESVGRRPHKEPHDLADPMVWLDLAHAVVALPVIAVTWTLTALWWFVALATASYPLRVGASPGSMGPMTLYLGGEGSHVAVSLGLTSPGARLAFALVIAVVVLGTLPFVTRACVTVQAGLGRMLLSSVSSWHRRVKGLEQERDEARAQVVAAASAEVDALRRLERDIHDGPQQQLVRLAMELGRAQHHFDSQPDLVRAALADAALQAQEALDDLRALSRGIAPPILVDRGLREALSALAERSAVPTELIAGPAVDPSSAAVEAAAYFVVAEALTNVAKHSVATKCVVGVEKPSGTLRVWVTDDGVGGAALAKGHGLQGLSDRVLAAGGQLQVDSPEGGPTTITAELPCP